MAARYSKVINKLGEVMASRDSDFLKELSQIISQKGLPEGLSFNGSTYTSDKIYSYLCEITEVAHETPKKKRTPAKKHVWVDPKELVMKAIEENEKENGKCYCLYIAAKGENKDKACGELIEEPVSIDIYENRCKRCKKSNETPESLEKATKKLKAKYKGILLSTDGIHGSPNRSFNIPENDMPSASGKFDAAEHTGMKDGTISPTSGPGDFINGKKEGLPSPSKAKPNRKPSPKFGSKLVAISKHDDYKDCRIKDFIDGNTWFVRVTNSPVSYTVGGKFEGEITDFPLNYLENLIELTEDEQIEATETMKASYKFLGESPEETEDPEDPEETEEEDDSGDDELDELIRGMEGVGSN